MKACFTAANEFAQNYPLFLWWFFWYFLKSKRAPKPISPHFDPPPTCEPLRMTSLDCVFRRKQPPIYSPYIKLNISHNLPPPLSPGRLTFQEYLLVALPSFKKKKNKHRKKKKIIYIHIKKWYTHTQRERERESKQIQNK